jgi:GNAT superfamily N-acetyltransferase
MPGDAWVGDHHAFWVLTKADEVCGFCSAVLIAKDATVFLSSAVVFPAHQGHGLQRRMITRRVTWARQQGATHLVTYTLPHNWQSVTSLLRTGFQRFVPEHNWAGKVWYFRATGG